MNQSSTNKAIVAGCRHGGLAIIRALGRAGIPVIALTHDPSDFGLASRYVQDIAICPHPKDQEAFINYMIANGEKWEGALLIETNDYYSTVLAMHKTQLETYYRLTVPDWAVTGKFIEKDATIALAHECDVPYPALHQAQSMQELDAIADSLVFPIMVKPVRSHEFVAHFDTKLFIVDDIVTLREKFQQTLDAQLTVMIQEIIPGSDEGTLESVEIYIDRNGEILAEQFNVKLRQSPPMFGVMRVGMSVPPISDIREYAHRLLKAVDYRGYASIEFKRDHRDGVAKLIEVNVRQARNGQMMLASGTNFPHIIYKDLILGETEIDFDYQPTYFIDLIPDVGNGILRDFKRTMNLPKFLRPYLAHHKTFAVLSSDDPKPFQVMMKAKFKKFLPV